MSATLHKIGRYEVREEIGRGAMGVVYRARDPIIGRDVAIKVLRVTAAVPEDEFAQFRHRFIREAQSAGILSHPNIVTVHDVVEESAEGFTFIAMEYVPGINLRQALQVEGGLPMDRALELLIQIATALDFAHSKGVVHRDVKPANVLITDDHRVKITDFGIARMDASNLTQDGQLLGTPNYMAPEQILGNDVDHRADLFSLGVVLYEALTRQKPFPGENLTSVAHRVVYEPFTPPEQYLPELPRTVSTILTKALEKDPAMRYQRGSELAADLRRALEEQRGEQTSATLGLGDRTAGGLRRPSPIPPNAASGLSANTEAATLALPPGARPAGNGKANGVAAPAKAPAKKPGKALAPTTPTAPAAAALASSAKPVSGASAAPLSAASERRAATLVVGTFAGLSLFLVAGLAVLAMRSPDAPAAPPGTQGDPAVAVVPAAPPSEPVPPHRSGQYVTAIANGQRLLAAGDAAGAAAAFAEAERLEPGDQAARTLRVEAERQAALVATGSTAKPPATAASTPARAPRPTRPVTPTPVTETPVEPAAPAVAAPAPEVASTSRLTIDFFTEVSPGTLTVYVEREQVYRQPFRFQRRAGLSRASIPGNLAAEKTVGAGDAELRIILALEGKKTQVLTVQGSFPGGQGRTLQVRVDASGIATASLN